jgi:hypothetical protein
MLSPAVKQKTTHWVPMGFCASLSLVTLTTQLVLAATNASSLWSWAIPFLGFLPMCFFFVGATTSYMQTEIQDLPKQVAELQSKAAG